VIELPWLGIQRSPSLSENAPSLRPVRSRSIPSHVRPVLGSVKRIGSESSCEVAEDLFSQSDFANDGHDRSKPTRRVCTSDWNMNLPVFQSAPIDGSPALRPRPLPGAGV
jgi:hypothetical protein